MVDDFGVDINLLATSPSMVLHLLKEANQRWHERQLGEALWPGEGRRCCTDVVRGATSRGAKAHDLGGKGIIKCIACDGFWGMHRRKEKGYDVEDVCPLCHATLTLCIIGCGTARAWTASGGRQLVRRWST